VNIPILKRISNHSQTASLMRYIKGGALSEAALELLNGVR